MKKRKSYIKVIALILILIIIDQILKTELIKEGLVIIPRNNKNYICS